MIVLVIKTEKLGWKGGSKLISGQLGDSQLIIKSEGEWHKLIIQSVFGKDGWGGN